VIVNASEREDRMGRVNRMMPRRDDDRWLDYGNWLELQRGYTSLTQAEMAKALGISPRHWIRYTQGAPVPQKRIPKIAELLGVPVDRALVRAGYEPTGEGVEIEAYLRRIRDYVLKGDLKKALFDLYHFYYDVAAEKKRYKPEAPVLTADNFVDAAVAVDKMPGWLRREFIAYLRYVDRGGSKFEFPAPRKNRKQVRAVIKAELLEAILREELVPHSRWRKKN
jgi:transcriptional regulator with XRE-family HTH domain